MILGLDISTNCTGYCVYDPETKTIIDKGVFKLEGEMYIRIDMLWEGLKPILELHKIESVHIEDFLMKFSIGRSSAFVINKLITFNSIISYLLYKEGLIIKRYNVLSARKKLFGIARSKAYKNSKELVMDQIKRVLGQEYIDTLPLNTRGNIAKEAGDINDAVVMALQ